MRESKQHYAHIDLLKSFAIFCVIIIHCYGLELDFWNGGSVIKYVNYFFRTLMSSSVPIFYLCSGYLLFSKEVNIKKHLGKTLHYLVITYVWAVLTIVIFMQMRNLIIPIGEIINIIREWRLGLINHLWYMGPFVCCYFVFPILKYAVDRKREILIYFVILVGFFTILNQFLDMVACVENDNAWLQSFGMFEPFGEGYDWVYVYFGLGGVLYLYKEEINEWMLRRKQMCFIASILTIIVSCIALWACGVFLTLKTGLHWDVVFNGYNSVFTLVMVFAMYSVSTHYQAKNKCIAWLVKCIGTKTLGIYFVHMLFIYASESFLAKTAMNADNILIYLYALMILVISTITTVVIQKLPVVQKLLFY